MLGLFESHCTQTQWEKKKNRWRGKFLIVLVFYCCLTLPQTEWLKTTQMYYELRTPTSVSGANHIKDWFLQEASGENLLLCLFQLLEAACIPWLMVHFLVFRPTNASPLWPFVFNTGIYSHQLPSKHCFCCIPYCLVCCVCIFLHPNLSRNSLVIFPFRDWLFRCVWFNFHIFGNSPNFLLLLISHFAPSMIRGILGMVVILCEFIETCFMA